MEDWRFKEDVKGKALRFFGYIISLIVCGMS